MIYFYNFQETLGLCLFIINYFFDNIFWKYRKQIHYTFIYLKIKYRRCWNNTEGQIRESSIHFYPRYRRSDKRIFNSFLPTVVLLCVIFLNSKRCDKKIILWMTEKNIFLKTKYYLPSLTVLSNTFTLLRESSINRRLN